MEQFWRATGIALGKYWKFVILACVAITAALIYGLTQIEFRQGYFEELPIADGWADVIISNGAINLCPDKLRGYREIHRTLKPGGRMQIADILVSKPVSDESKRDIDLWTG